MNILITALYPIFALIAIGYIFKRIKFPNLEFWIALDKLSYYAFFPALLVYKLARANFEDINTAFDMVIVIMIVLIIVTILLSIIQYFLKFKPSSYTSIYQGGSRYNTYVFLALVNSLYGNQGIALAAFLIAFIIPFINILCVSIFGIYINEGKFSLKRLWISIVKNPLIIACFLGAFLNFSGIGLPFEDVVKLFSAPAIPLVLLSIGVGLEFKSLMALKLDFWVSSFVKLIAFPIITIFIMNFFELNTLMKNILILFAAMPTATSAYTLARELKGDLVLMSTIITGQTILSFLTISAILLYVG